MSDLPTVVLAFANDQEGHRYLRDLPEELRRLQEIVRTAEGNGLCRLELLPNATLDQVFEVFTRNRDRVTVFHYAGHADSGRLLLESAGVGAGSAANAAGLAAFLGQRQGLQLVFLNGCSTRAQVTRLLEAGVAAVIATARAIDDAMARDFATAFYTELASGASLRSAYEGAKGRVLAAHGDAPEAYYGRKLTAEAEPQQSASPDPADDLGFPWEFRPGAELVERWSLADAAGNPGFGLPRLPERDLPESPFRNLNWFTAEHAEVFFGRGYQVRELYEQVVDPAGPPVLLLYGSSGVGKSSLLDAGLVPRLESGGSAVRYRRRDPLAGLSATLADALGGPAAPGELWRAEEARLGRPVVVFLDQVEEVFTRPDTARPHELDEFVAALTELFARRETRPKGKLVLGFRKEWLAEIDRRLAEAKLPRTKVFLKQLDRRGIIEAIRGPERPGRLLRQYRLTVEPGLPEVIADDLCTDAGSALAPTLQVLLTKMWERARQARPDEPRFDRALYESLKAEGYLLNDVLDEGLRGVGLWSPEAEQTGLTLDVLAYHTTDLGTAAQRTRSELDRRYPHRADVLAGLLARCTDHYLLIEAETAADATARSTRLAHDLLAPLVLQRFRISVAPGQRARRLLENRVPDWKDGKSGPVLDETDLATIEAGEPGMRARTPDEDRLVAASHEAEDRETARRRAEARRVEEAEAKQREAEAERQRETERSNRRLRRWFAALAATLAVTAGVAVVAFNQWKVAERASEVANRETAEALTASGLADVEQGHSFDAMHRFAAAMAVAPLAAENVAANGQQLAVLQTQVPHLRAVLEGDHNGVYRGWVNAVAFHPGNELLVTASSDGMVRVWDWKARRTVAALEDRGDWFYSASFNPAGDLIVAPTGDGSAVVWDWKAGTRTEFGDPGGRIQFAAFSPDGKSVATASGDGTVQVWDWKTGDMTASLNGVAKPIQSAAFSPDGALIVAASADNSATVWDWRTRRAVATLKGHTGWVNFAAFSPDGSLVVTASADGTARVWRWKDAGNGPVALLIGHSYWVVNAHFDRDGAHVVTASEDGTARVWDWRNQRSLAELKGHVDWVNAADFSPDGTLIATASSDGTTRVWETPRVAPPVQFRGHSKDAYAAAFSPDGSRVVTASDDGTARVWDAESGRLTSTIEAGGGGVFSAAFHPDGSRLVLGTKSGLAGVWDVRTGAGVPLPGGHVNAVRSAVFSPDGTRAATASDDGTARVWDWKAGSPVTPPLPHRYPVRCVAFSPDGSRVATACEDGVVRTWDARTGTPVAELKGHENWVNSVAYSPDGARIVSASKDWTARVWPSAGGRAVAVLKAHRGGVKSAAFSDDGSLIVTASQDGTARVWKSKGGESVAVLRGHNGAVNSAVFSRGGRRVLTASADRTARIWSLDTIPGEPRSFRLWVQVYTGTELQGEVVRPLSAAAWTTRCRELLAKSPSTTPPAAWLLDAPPAVAPVGVSARTSP